ncbi:MAG: S-adenosyl-l-methionine hydroxide adenosyltransferase family protein [Bacteroidota bacterium]
MSVITFMSDFGTEDHYVAAVKAAILKHFPECKIIDLSHHIGQADIAHAAYVLKNVYNDFPEHTVHLIAIDSVSRVPSKLVAVKWNNHFFVGPDSGVFSLIGNLETGEAVEIISEISESSTFIAKDVLAPAASKLAKDHQLSEIGKPYHELKKLFPRQLKVTKREIAGNVIRVDHYGNLITNINKTEFDTIVKLNGNSKFQIQFGRERTNKVNLSYHEVESGECYVIFNSRGYIQIGINKGNASELLGLYLDTPINVYFDI